MKIKKHKNSRQRVRKQNRSGVPVNHYPGKRVWRIMRLRRAKEKFALLHQITRRALVPKLNNRSLLRWYRGLLYETNGYSLPKDYVRTAGLYPLKLDDAYQPAILGYADAVGHVNKAMMAMHRMPPEILVLPAPRHPETGSIFHPGNRFFVGVDPYTQDPKDAESVIFKQTEEGIQPSWKSISKNDIGSGLKKHVDEDDKPL